MQFHRANCTLVIITFLAVAVARPPVKDVVRRGLSRKMIRKKKNVPLIGDKGEPRQRLLMIPQSAAFASLSQSADLRVARVLCACVWVAERGTFIETRVRTLFRVTYLGCIDVVHPDPRTYTWSTDVLITGYRKRPTTAFYLVYILPLSGREELCTGSTSPPRRAIRFDKANRAKRYFFALRNLPHSCRR